MPSIAEVREKFPMYGEISDRDLADRVREKFYSDIPQPEFYKQLGLTEMAKPDPKTAGEIKNYDPTLRDTVSRYLMGDERPSPERARLVEGLTGSRGMGKTGTGILDMSPAGPIFAGQETQRSMQEGDYVDAGLSALGMMPAAGAPTQQISRFALGRGLSPTARAAQKVAGAAQADVAAATGREASSVGPAELAHGATRALGGVSPSQDVRLLDMYGEGTRREARTAANKSPQAGGALRDVVEPRFEGQADRTIEYLRATYQNPQQAFQTIEMLKDAAKSQKSAAYKAAYEKGAKNGVPAGVNSPGLDQLMSSEFMQGVEKEAAKRWETMRVAGNAPGPVMGHNSKPTLAYYDQVKRVLDDKIASARETPEFERNLTAIKQRLVGYLDQAVPEFAAARGVAAKTFRASDAAEAGEWVAQGKFTNAEVADVTKQMKPDEAQIFRGAFLAEKIKEISFSPDRKNLVLRLMQSPGERGQIEAVLGPKGAKDFLAFLQVEEVMDMARTAIGGNSTTVRQAYDAARDSIRELTLPAVTSASMVAATGDIKTAIVGALMYGARRAQQVIDEKTAVKVAEMLLSKDPSVYAKGLREVTTSVPMQRSLQDYISSVPAAAYAGGQAASGLGRDQSDPQHVTTPEEAAKLPPGTWVQTPDGQVRQRK